SFSAQFTHCLRKIHKPGICLGYASSSFSLRQVKQGRWVTLGQLMEHILSNNWSKRFFATLMAYDIMRVWEAGTRIILSFLTLTILLGLAGGVVKTFLDLRLLLSTGVEVALRQVLVDTLTLLAVVEVLKTTLTYCSDGRVRVTFIIDTVLVVMLTELISRWFTSGEWNQFAILGGIILMLGVMRIIAIRYSPALPTSTQQADQLGF